MSEDIQRQVADFVQSLVRGGFLTVEQMVAQVLLVYGQDGDPAEIEEITARSLSASIDELERDQAGWPPVTDCDRLDAAFEQLNADGIIARHHWACCSGCGSGLMVDEHEDLGGQWQGKPLIGYVFYSHQATEQAVRGERLLLDCGSTQWKLSTGKWETDSARISEIVFACLESHGLQPQWSGWLLWLPLRWQRRSAPSGYWAKY